MSSNHGGKREGAGRKPKADEDKLQARLSELDEAAFDAMKNGVDKKEYAYVKLFFEYRYGKPKQQIDHTNDGKSFNAAPSIVVHNVGPSLADSEEKIEA